MYLYTLLYITCSASNTRQHAATQSFLESQLVASEALKSADDYRYWLEAFMEHLGAHGPEKALRRVLDDLLGPSVLVIKDANDTSKREILVCVGAYIDFHQLFNF